MLTYGHFDCINNLFYSIFIVVKLDQIAISVCMCEMEGITTKICFFSSTVVIICFFS